MSVYFETIELSVLFFPLIGLLMFIPTLIIHRKEYDELHEYRLFVLYLFAFSIVTAMLLTVLPLPKNITAFCLAKTGTFNAQMILFASFYDISEYAKTRALGWSIGDISQNRALWQIIFNLLLLVPAGFFIRALYRTTLIQTVLIGLALSLSFELTQLTGIWGLADCSYRLFDIDDLLTNTLGAGLGWVLFGYFHWLPDPSAPEDDLWYRRK